MGENRDFVEESQTTRAKSSQDKLLKEIKSKST